MAAHPDRWHFTFPIGDNCRYTAEVRGTARPAGGSAGSASANADSRTNVLYSAHGTIDASVSCPNRAMVRVTERLETPHPMSIADIEHAIEMRASIVGDDGDLHCACVPNFTLTTFRLEGVGAALLCPLPALESAPGGGPAEGTNQ